MPDESTTSVTHDGPAWRITRRRIVLLAAVALVVLLVLVSLWELKRRSAGLRAAREVEAVGGIAKFEYPGPQWFADWCERNDWRLLGTHLWVEHPPVVGRLDGVEYIPLPDEELRRLLQAPTLKGIYLGDFNQVSDEHLALLKSHPQLASLRLDRPNVGPDGLKHVQGIRNLRDLGLTGMTIDAEVGQVIESLTRLEELQLDECRFPDGVRFLENMKQLWYLDLSYTQLDSDDIQSIVTLPNLKGLILDGTPLDDAMLMQLTAVNSLEFLSHFDTQVTPDGEKRFRAVRPDCKKLHIWRW